MSDPVTGDTNPYSDPDSLEHLHWRYDHDPLFHALVHATHRSVEPQGLTWPWTFTARQVQRVLTSIEQLGFVLTLVDDAAAKERVRIASEYLLKMTAPITLTVEDENKIKDLLQPHEHSDFTMQDMVEYHHFDTRVIRPGQYPCNSVTFRMLMGGENSGFRCVQCGKDIKEDEVLAWKRAQDLAGTRFPESSE